MTMTHIEHYDEDGNMTKIEVRDGAGEHHLDFVWDPSDEQTSENRILFRQWVTRFLGQKESHS